MPFSLDQPLLFGGFILIIFLGVVQVCDFGLSRLKHNTFLTSKSSAGTVYFKLIYDFFCPSFIPEKEGYIFLHLFEDNKGCFDSQTANAAIDATMFPY